MLKLFNCRNQLNEAMRSSTCSLHAGLSWEMTQQHRFQNERQDHEVSEAGNGGRFEQSFHTVSAAERQLTTAR